MLPSFSQSENLKPEINPIKTILIRKEAEVFGEFFLDFNGMNVKD